MPVSTGAVQTADDYAVDNDGNGAGGATIGLFETLSSIQFQVGPEGNVIAQVGKMKKQDNSTRWDPTEVTFGPGPGGYEGEIHGLRFRSAESGTPVSVVINGYFADDPIPFQVPPATLPLSAGGMQFGGPSPVYGAANVGQYFQLEATGHRPSDDTAIQLIADNGEVLIEGLGVLGGMVLQVDNGNAIGLNAGGGGLVQVTGGVARIAAASNEIATTALEKVGFFGVPAVVQPGHPVTLADVIAAGQALGLWA